MYFNDLWEQFKYIFIPNVIDKNKVLQALVKVQRTKKVDVEDLEEQWYSVIVLAIIVT